MPSAGASVRMQQLKERLGDAQEELRTKMSSVKQRSAQVIRELKVVLRRNTFRCFLNIISAPYFIFCLEFCMKINKTSVPKGLSVGSAFLD